MRHVSLRGLTGIALALAVVASVGGRVQADPIITVYPSVGVNAPGSPSTGGYATNAITGLQAGGGATGSPTSPTYYSTTNNVSVSDIIVTNFPSWRGDANPTGAFANEAGNRLYFGLHVNGNGSQFSLSQLDFAVSTSPSNVPAFNFTDAFGAGDTYSATRVGRIGNTFITSGPATQLVDELFYVGIGDAFPATIPGGGITPSERQSALDSLIASTGGFTISATYSLRGTGVSGTGVVNVTAAPAQNEVPEPASVLLWAGAGLAALVGRRLRRK